MLEVSALEHLHMRHGKDEDRSGCSEEAALHTEFVKLLFRRAFFNSQREDDLAPSFPYSEPFQTSLGRRCATRLNYDSSICG